MVKAFNTTGWPNMERPDYSGQAATMFVCGDDPEPLAMLWIDLSFFRGQGTNIAFRLLRR